MVCLCSEPKECPGQGKIFGGLERRDIRKLVRQIYSRSNLETNKAVTIIRLT